MTTTIWEWPREHRGTVTSEFTLTAKNLSATSTFTDESAYSGPVVQRFVAKLAFPLKRGPDWRMLSGFIVRLRGRQGLLRMVDYHRMFSAWDTAKRNDHTTRNWSDGRTWSDGRGWADGFLPPVVTVGEAAPEGARSVVLHGLPVSQSAVLTLGDLVEMRLGGAPASFCHLYENAFEVGTDSQGRARIEFEPGLAQGVMAGDQAVLRYPSGVFRFASDTEGAIRRALGNSGQLSLNLVGVLPPEVVA